MKELDWLSKELNKDDIEIEKHKGKFIQKITSLDKKVISNTVHVTEEPKTFGILWRLKKVLGM